MPACLWRQHIDSADLPKELRCNGVVIFFRGPKNSFCTPHHLFALEVENALPQESSMEIVDVWIFLFSLSLSLKTHIKSTHPYITDSSFQSDFKLPCILAKHRQDPLLLFLLISCVYGVSGCPPHAILSLFFAPSHLLTPLLQCSPASRNRQVICTLTPTELHAGRDSMAGSCDTLPPLRAFCRQPNPLATNCDLFLIKKTAKQFCMPVQCVRF